MKKVKDIQVLNNNYSGIDFNNIDFIGLDADGSVIFPEEVEIDAEEFNYQLKAIIASYNNLINLSSAKIVQDHQQTIH